MHPFFERKSRSAQTDLKIHQKVSKSSSLRSKMKPHKKSKPKLSRGMANSKISNYFVKNESNPILNLLRHIDPDSPDMTDTLSPDPSVTICH